MVNTVCLFSNETKDDNIASHQDYVESCTMAHMRDAEKLFFVYFSFWLFTNILYLGTILNFLYRNCQLRKFATAILRFLKIKEYGWSSIQQPWMQRNYVKLSLSSSWTGQNTSKLLIDEPSSVSSIDLMQVAVWPEGERQLKTEKQQSLKRISTERRNSSPKKKASLRPTRSHRWSWTLLCHNLEYPPEVFEVECFIAPSKPTRRTWKTD